MPVAPIPRATYRLQLGGDFTFEDTTRVVSYLADLGISHVYLSPYLKAREGSTHGYDIADHNAFNGDIGDEGSFDVLCETLASHDMGQILDFVPNHMGIGRAENAWWLDVLEWGRESVYVDYFDIDWEPAKPELRGKVLVPFLGDHYGTVIEGGELRLAFDALYGTFSVWYYEHRFPIIPGEYARILKLVRVELEALEAIADVLVEMELLIAGFEDLRKAPRSGRSRSTRRGKSKKLKRQLAELCRQEAIVVQAIESVLGKINRSEEQPGRPEWLHKLLEAQPYRLAYWRVAAEEINYRRFFQINDLAGIRIEEPAVFDHVHRLILTLISEGKIQGLRIDHIDGLFDPRGYLQRLQAKIEEVSARSLELGDAGGGDDGALLERHPFYIVVEKILAPHEHLREEWPIAGTTGYEFLNSVNGLFVDPRGEAPLSQLYQEFTGLNKPLTEIIYEAKKQAMDNELASELRVLANEFNRLTESNWLTRDFTLVGLRQALREVVACFPVYRTYVDGRLCQDEDRTEIDEAVTAGRRRSSRADKSVFDFIHSVLTTDSARGKKSLFNRAEVQRLAQKFQQYTGPVTAKGVEDTAFYRFNRLASLNEVGGEPAIFGTDVETFHAHNLERVGTFRHSMLSTGTHDMKRGEDVRARLNVLSEMPQEWTRCVRKWSVLNRRRKTPSNEGLAPSSNDEYLFYQTLVGAWPATFHNVESPAEEELAEFRGRVREYMIKAVREAKTASSWLNQNEDYENALTTFVDKVMDSGRRDAFWEDFRSFQRDVAVIGMVNGLAQVVLKLTAPGTPDIYQGCESWDLSLVDPDNRRPVNFHRHAAELADLREAFAAEPQSLVADLLHRWPDGAIKMFVTWRLLSLRRELPTVFCDGDYTPLTTMGTGAERLVAFARESSEGHVLTIVPRLVGDLMPRAKGDWPIGPGVWRDAAVVLEGSEPAKAWRNIFTGEVIATGQADGESTIRVADMLASMPVGVFVDADAAPS